MRRADVRNPLQTLGDRRLRTIWRQPEMVELLERFTVPSLRQRAQQLGIDAFWDRLAREQYQRQAELALADAEAELVNRVQLEANFQRRDERASAEREAARDAAAERNTDGDVIQTILDGIIIRPPAVVVMPQTEAAPLPTVSLPEPTLDDAIAAWAAWYAENPQG